MRKKKSMIFMLFCCVLSLGQLALQGEDVQFEEESVQEELWAKSIARVTEVTPIQDGHCSTTIEYEVPESTACDPNGEVIQGPIVQHLFPDSSATRKVGEKFPIRYLKKEPVVFEYDNDEDVNQIEE